MSAARDWAEGLASWAIPPEILDAAPESPFTFPVEVFRLAPGEIALSPTHERVSEALPDGGTILDVGAGGGAASLPVAERASLVTAVDQSAQLLEEFLASATASGVAARAVEGSWTASAPRVEPSDVVVCAHVLYNVADIQPFVEALDARARVRVVLELTHEHPLRWMNDLWMRLHNLERPDSPTVDTAIAALVEMGFRPRRQDHSERPQGTFASREDAVASIRRRLCVPADMDGEIAEALGERLLERQGLWAVGPPDQPLATLWWDR